MCARGSEYSGVYLFGRVCACGSVFVRECVYLYVCSFVCVFVSMFSCMNKFLCLCIRVCLYVCFLS